MWEHISEMELLTIDEINDMYIEMQNDEVLRHITVFQYSRILIGFKSIFNDGVLTIETLMSIQLLNGGVVYGNCN